MTKAKQIEAAISELKSAAETLSKTTIAAQQSLTMAYTPEYAAAWAPAKAAEKQAMASIEALVKIAEDQKFDVILDGYRTSKAIEAKEIKLKSKAMVITVLRYQHSIMVSTESRMKAKQDAAEARFFNAASRGAMDR